MLTITTYVLTADAEKTTCFCSRKTIINAEWWNITVDGTARVLDCNQFQSLFISVARNGHDMAVCDSGQLVSKTGNESYFYNSFKPATFKMDTFQFITLKVRIYIYIKLRDCFGDLLYAKRPVKYRLNRLKRLCSGTHNVRPFLRMFSSKLWRKCISRVCLRKSQKVWNLITCWLVPRRIGFQ